MSRKSGEVYGGKAISGGEPTIGTVFHQDFGQVQSAVIARLLQSRSSLSIVQVDVDSGGVVGQKGLDEVGITLGYHRCEIVLMFKTYRA